MIPSAARAQTPSVKETTMLPARRARFAAFALTTALLAPILLASVAPAGAFELSGAWATDADLCNRIFTRKGNEVVFAELSDLYGSGFVINGNRIIGKAAQCTIESRKQDGNGLDLAAACASSIMTQNMKFSLKVIDDNTINRSIEEVPGMNLKYSRCKI
jgi:hypothetical protein